MSFQDEFKNLFKFFCIQDKSKSSFKRGETRGNSIFFDNLLESRTKTGTSFVYFRWISIDTSLLSISIIESTIGGFKLIRLIVDNFFSSVSHKQQPFRENKINTSEFIFQGQDHNHKV